MGSPQPLAEHAMTETHHQKRLLVATTNRGKLAEFRLLLEPVGFEVLSLDDVAPGPAPVEDGSTFEANAIIKATAWCARLGLPVIADDSGLVVDALDGAPGVHSARYAGEDGDDAANNRKLLVTMDKVADDDRTARFVAVICYAQPEEEPVTFRGVVEGRIGRVPKGDGGFGYDVLFHPRQTDGSFAPYTTAEIPAADKAAISHRGEAARALVAWLAKENAVERT